MMPAAQTPNSEMLTAETPAAQSKPTVRVVPGGAICGRVRPPGSKSLTNRALICAAFATGTSRLNGSLVSEDTEVMIESLAKIGVSIESHDGGRSLVVVGIGKRIGTGTDEAVEMFIANSGTTVRFLTAALSAVGGRYRLSGVERMHERPIGDLVDAIAILIDGTIETVSPGGCPPVLIDSVGWTARPTRVAGNVSSQYLSGLMMAGPIAAQGPGADAQSIEIGIEGEMVSLPYVRMTAKLMEDFGGRTEWTFDNPTDQTGLRKITVSGTYRGRDYAIEPDASAASYFWAAAAITGGRVRVDGLNENACQGDVGFVRVLRRMGTDIRFDVDSIEVGGRANKGVDVDMGEISDTVQTLSVVALFTDEPTRVRGVAHNRFKETDRIGNLAIELRKLGARIDEHTDGLTIHPLTPDDITRLEANDEPIVFETYNDHRMAMSFALLGLRLPNIVVSDPACTRKTYPEFWADLERLSGRAHHWSRQGRTDLRLSKPPVAER